MFLFSAASPQFRRAHDHRCNPALFLAVTFYTHAPLESRLALPKTRYARLSRKRKGSYRALSPMLQRSLPPLTPPLLERLCHQYGRAASLALPFLPDPFFCVVGHFQVL